LQENGQQNQGYIRAKEAVTHHKRKIETQQKLVTTAKHVADTHATRVTELEAKIKELKAEKAKFEVKF
jgi:hypothetical protein